MFTYCPPLYIGIQANSQQGIFMWFTERGARTETEKTRFPLRDVHQTRSIKTNSTVNLSRTSGLDLSCDLLQHLHWELRTCTKTFQFFCFNIIIRWFCSSHYKWSGSDWGRHSKSCCKTPLGNLAEYCLTNIARACNFFYHRCCVKSALSYIKSRKSDHRMW